MHRGYKGTRTLLVAMSEVWLGCGATTAEVHMSALSSPADQRGCLKTSEFFWGEGQSLIILEIIRSSLRNIVLHITQASVFSDLSLSSKASCASCAGRMRSKRTPGPFLGRHSFQSTYIDLNTYNNVQPHRLHGSESKPVL